MSEDEIGTAFGHLVNVLGLVGLSREEWSERDCKNIQRAREFVLDQQRKEEREGKYQEAGLGDVGEVEGRPQGGETPAGVRQEGILVEEGAQNIVERPPEE
jgi:hypothetical protein